MLWVVGRRESAVGNFSNAMRDLSDHVVNAGLMKLVGGRAARDLVA
jgi:hypothetical protein